MNRPNPSNSSSRPPSSSKSLSQSSSFDDLPEAVREAPSVSKKAQFKPMPIGVWLLIGLGGIGLLGLLIRLMIPNPSTPGTPIAQASPSASPASEMVLGHYAYPEAPEAELTPITADGGIKLRKSAAAAYQAMVQDAQVAGVSLVPLSGFRSVKEQESVFFEVKQQRAQTVSERADVSAPPGHSEHHTGYAIDIGDGAVPSTNLSPDFENTASFKWLEANAVKYSFELSFPKGNPQGVTYEPWHWRFVGDRDSLETFFKAKNPATPTESPSPAQSPSPAP